jgi:hypothetical protein
MGGLQRVVRGPVLYNMCPSLVAANARAGLTPDRSHAEVPECRIGAHERQPLDARLCGEHAVEWVAMCPAQLAGLLSMAQIDGEWQEAQRLNRPGKIRQQRLRCCKLAQPGLGCDLPGRRRADEHILVGMAQTLAQLLRDAGVAFQPPDQGVRIEEGGHPSILAPFPELQLLLGQGIEEEGIRQLQLAFQHAKGTAPTDVRRQPDRHQARDRLPPARDHDLLALFHALDELGQVGLGGMDGVRGQGASLR